MLELKGFLKNSKARPPVFQKIFKLYITFSEKKSGDLNILIKLHNEKINMDFEQFHF